MTSTLPGVASKLLDVGVTVFTAMSRLAAERRAINLLLRFRDIDCDSALAAAAAGHMKNDETLRVAAERLRHVSTRHKVLAPIC